LTCFDWWWPVVWLGGAFLIVELIAALDKKPGGTLSEWVWSVFIYPSKNRHLCRMIFGAFWVALTAHFFVQSSVVFVIAFGLLMVLPIIWWWERK